MLKTIIVIVIILLLVNWWRRAGATETSEKMVMGSVFSLSVLLMLYLYWFDQ